MKRNNYTEKEIMRTKYETKIKTTARGKLQKKTTYNDGL